MPQKFKEKLEQHQGLDGLLNLTLSTFGEILLVNKLYFFEEYTDHGVEHIENILKMTDYLIPDATYDEFLSPADIAYYILSVILHDIGMHLGLDGFQMIINGYFDDVRQKNLDKLTWGDLWEDFLNEMARTDKDKLNGILGIDKLNFQSVLKAEPILENVDRRIIGEFIRRNHPRLAHEIALKGFPGQDTLKFCPDLPMDERNLVGFIARSHGMNLRTCIDYLGETLDEVGHREINNVHPTILMVLLRLADYLQIDRSRTSISIKLKTFSSSISEIEHFAHSSTNSVAFGTHQDPERIYVNATPRTSKMFLKLKQLVHDIQSEFDVSWAVIGEVYGRFIPYPTLNFRRISSNFEKLKFIERQTYVAEDIAFKVNSEVLNLLIKPLYGYNPTYGVRELLQNSIDACLERQALEVNFLPQITVTVSSKEGLYFFEIVDNGIGMDVGTIKNYFFTVGASYRRSMDWQKMFIDNQGNSRVSRSGRFGVGILAAFLLGDLVSVTTRKIATEQGYKFSFKTPHEDIEISKETAVPEGTTIRIQLSKQTCSTLADQANLRYIDKVPTIKSYVENHEWFNWYRLATPNVTYNFDHIKITPKTTIYSQEEVVEKWNELHFDGFQKILWSFEDGDGHFYCNGFIVPKFSALSGFFGAFLYPALLVFDNNNLIPLSLNRNDVSGTLPFANELESAVRKDFIAYLLTIDLDFLEICKKCRYEFRYKGLLAGHSRDIFSYGENLYDDIGQSKSTILFAKDGYMLNVNFFISKINHVRTIGLMGSSVYTEDCEDLLQRNFFLSFYTDKDARFHRTEANFPDACFYFRKTDQNVFIPDRIKFSGKIKKMDGWNMLKIGNFQSSLPEEFIEKNIFNLSLIRENVSHPYAGEIDKMDLLLERYLGDDVIIPYSLSERAKKFPEAFRDLEPYMRKYLVGRTI